MISNSLIRSLFCGGGGGAFCGAFGGAGGGVAYDPAQLKEIAIGAASKVEAQMDEFKFNLALEEIWTVVRRANKYIDENIFKKYLQNNQIEV